MPARCDQRPSRRRRGVRQRRTGTRHHRDRRPDPPRLDPGLRYGHRRGHSHRVPRLHHQRSAAQSARGVCARRGRTRPAAEPRHPRPQPDPFEQGPAARRRHSNRLCPVRRQRDVLPPAGRALRAHRGPEGLGPDRLRTAHSRRGDQLHHAAGAGRPRRPARRLVRQQGLPRDPRPGGRHLRQDRLHRARHVQGNRRRARQHALRGRRHQPEGSARTERAAGGHRPRELLRRNLAGARTRDSRSPSGRRIRTRTHSGTTRWTRSDSARRSRIGSS